MSTRLVSAQHQVKKTHTPQWVQSISSFSQPLNKPEGGSHYLLVDRQVHLPHQMVFFHYAVQVFTAEGVQSLSDINITFDPSYQQVQLHQLTLKRGATLIDKLPESQIQILQRETSLERSLYDGSLTAVINLSDVRPLDIIEYSYSVVGFNPIYDGHFATTLYQQHSVPVTQIYHRIVTAAKQKLQIDYYEGATQPTVTRSSDEIAYTWDEDAQDYHLPANNLPASFDPYRRVALSTYASWEEVVAWALPLYDYPERSLSAIIASLPDAYDQERKLLAMIHLVQDDIRYLGFEGGIGGYKPHPPAESFKQRYGDCKDKSLLLVALLRSEGVDANPLLVNTQLRGEVRELLPAPHAFDHCIVHFRHQGNEYVVDPTTSAQGGDLAHRAFPNYEQGLLIKPGSKQLIRLPQPSVPQVTIRELIAVDSIGGSAQLVVRSEYTGDRADNIRRQFQTQRKNAIEQEYLDFYRKLYPSILSSDTIRFYDYDRTTLNKIMVEEFYQIPSFWDQNENDASLQAELYPIVLASQLGYPVTPSRGQPYYLGEPYSYTQITQVELPEDWPVTPSEQHITGPGFDYQNQMQGSGNTVTIHHQYALNQNQIPGDSVEQLLRRQEEVENELSLFLTYDPALAGNPLSWLSVFVAVVVAAIGIWFARQLYQRYDLPAWRYAENKSIGSWLILPAIGLTITPFVIGRDLFTEGYFNEAIWQGVRASEHSSALFLFIGVELIYNVLFLVFTFLVLLLFYQRRTSAPRLVTIFYALSLFVPILDGWIAGMLLEDLLSEQDQLDSYKEIGKSFLTAAIWIPYFNLSDRVKSTFCKQRSPQETKHTVDLYATQP